MAGYTGISFPFRIGFRGGVVMSTTTDMEIQHIQESIRQILLTRRGERVNEPEFGADLYHSVFENIDATLVNVLSYKVQTALERWEPRIEVREIFIREIDGGVEVIVDFIVLRTSIESTSSVSFYREAA